MKQFISLAAFFVLSSCTVSAQKHYTKNGSISFFSKTSLENISADNNQVLCILDTQTGEIQFSLLVKSFHFSKALMEEHFNEDYMESDKFPRATFKGNITDISRISSFTVDGMYTVPVEGNMTIHGVTKKVTITGTLTINGGKITASSKFFVKISDYNINIPTLVKDNIAESIEITVSSRLDQKM
jgi:hypothetical protein